VNRLRHRDTRNGEIIAVLMGVSGFRQEHVGLRPTCRRARLTVTGRRRFHPRQRVAKMKQGSRSLEDRFASLRALRPKIDELC